jgi:hypothetical protein
MKIGIHILLTVVTGGAWLVILAAVALVKYISK